MTTLLVFVLMWAGLAVMFVVGLVSGATAFVFAAFCLWTPVTFALGWAVARAGVRVVTGAAPERTTPARPMRRRVVEDI